MNRFSKLYFLTALAAPAAASPLAAETPAEFYKGKQLHLNVGLDSGGGYGTYARALARRTIASPCFARISPPRSMIPALHQDAEETRLSIMPASGDRVQKLVTTLMQRPRQPCRRPRAPWA